MLVLVIVLGITVLVGTTVSDRYRIAPPVLLVILGGLLGLVPGIVGTQLDPEWVLLLFLPPILFRESLTTSLREIRANLRVIALSGTALVLATAAAVALVAQALGVEPYAAWVLGAVLAPTDAAAVAGLARRMPRRTLTTLKAESLINDGTALVLLAVALSAANAGRPPGTLELARSFFGSYAGGLLAGLLTGVVVVAVSRRLDDPLRGGALSLLTPFMAFLAADAVHASGVVAVVVVGLFIAHRAPRVVRARTRLADRAFWNLATFLLNGALFVFVGIEVPTAVRDLDSTSIRHALVVAACVTGVVVVTRLVWTQLLVYVVRALDRRPVQRARRVSWRQRLASGWAGFRGAVSLAAALAVPTTLASGKPFPDRDLIIFTTAVVIVATMLVQGLTLPAVMRWAGLQRQDTAREDELRLARLRSSEAALAALPYVATAMGLDEKLLGQVRRDYEEQAALVRAETDHDDTGDVRSGHENARQLRLAVLEYERSTVTDLRDIGEIDDIVLRDMEATLDLEEARLRGPTLSE